MPWKDKEKIKAYFKVRNPNYYQKNRERILANGKKRRRKILDWFFAYKNTLSCSKCDESDPDCLDFHHVGEKKDSISQLMAQLKPKEQILAEIEKCIVLCANCHRKLHRNNRYKTE